MKAESKALKWEMFRKKKRRENCSLSLHKKQ